MIEIIAVFLVIGIFILGLYLGYVFAFRVVNHLFKITPEVFKKELQTPLNTETKNSEIQEMPLGPEDTINHEGIGIVQRPSAEELARFAEPQQVKEAKAAMAEEFRKQEEIDKATM